MGRTRAQGQDSQAQSASSILVTRSMKKPQASGRGLLCCLDQFRYPVPYPCQMPGHPPPDAGSHELVEAGHNLALPLQARKANRTTARMPASDVVAPSARLPVVSSAARLAQTATSVRTAVDHENCIRRLV